MWNPFGPQYLPNNLQQQQQPQHFPPQFQHPPPQPIQHPQQNHQPNQQKQHNNHNNTRGRANSSVSAQTKRKNNSPDKVEPKKSKATQNTPKKAKFQHKKSDKKDAAMLFIGDLSNAFELEDEVNLTKLSKLCKHRLKNYSAETYVINATCTAEYESALLELNQFIGIKTPLLYVVFVCSTNTDLAFEQFFTSVCALGITPELLVGVLPEPNCDMSKLDDNKADELIAHRKLAFSVYSKIRRVNIISLSTWSDPCEPKVGTRINKLFNKISAFEPEKSKVLKFYANVPKGKLACSSAKGLELLKKD